MTTTTHSAYQREAIALLEQLGSVRYRETFNGIANVEAVEVATGQVNHKGVAPAVRLRFEEDAVVYIAVGQIGAHGFWSDGTEITMCNTPVSVVKATIRALLAEVAK